MAKAAPRPGKVESSHPGIAPDVGPDDPRRFTDSGIEIQTVYRDQDIADLDLEERLGDPGEYPFTRGIHPEMYRSRRWTMRQYAGYATAQETNVRYRYLLEKGSTGLSMAFDLPTQLGRDSDDPLCLGEVGRTGVAIDSIDDMRTAFDQIPLDQVSTSMTINAPAAILLLLYELVGEEQGVPSEQLRGTVQNDILKEYAARGNFIFPPEGAMRLTTDIFAYCNKHVPKWNTISISGYHMREKGCSAVQEVAFTLSNAIAYVQAAIDAGLEVDDFAGQIAFFFNGHNNVFQEVAKFRAVRKMWAEIMHDRFGARTPRSQMVRFHTQTGGSTLTAQQPENNIVRVALQGFAAVCGGTQSLHTNGFDEALGLPTERSAKIALRTQQVIAEESGAADTVDPFAGSYYVERLTADIEREARALMEQIEDLGGSVHAIEAGFLQREIEEAAWAFHRRIQTGQDVLVGVNRYVEDDGEVDVEILKIDRNTERDQVGRLKAFKENRDQEQVARRLQNLHEVAVGSGNLLYPLKDALRDRATLGEVCNVMREVFGEYKPPV
jgi:methylmalonyl-CoA mutase, N-terminal domain